MCRQFITVYNSFFRGGGGQAILLEYDNQGLEIEGIVWLIPAKLPFLSF